MAKSKTPKTRVTVELPQNLVRQLDREAGRLKKRGGRGSRTEALAEAVRRHFLGTHGGHSTLMGAYGEIRQEAVRLKAHGIEKLGQCSVAAAKRSFLLACSKELEALSLLSNPDEATVRSAVIEAVMLLKDGVGYRSLPDVPGGRKTENVTT